MNNLITTKFSKPNLGQFTIRRTRIIELLQRHIDVPIILFCAPAGFGKSTMLVQWAEMLNHPYYWLSLDIKDQEPRRFTAYLAATFLANNDQQQSYQLIKEKFEHNGNTQDYLTEILSLVTTPTTLILDDVHFLADSESAQLLNLLITALPSNIQLVMAARHSRFIDLSHARLNMQCLEIDERQLKFDFQELILMTNRKVSPWFSVPELELSHLYQASEGWPAGIQLALLAHQDDDSYTRALTTSTNHHTIDYLTVQAINHLSEPLQDFLLRTSFLDRFNPALANLVADTDQAAVLINQLDTKNLFLVNLGFNSQWFRYHHLFRQVLQSIALSKGINEKDIYRNAYQWCLSHQLDEEAINYALLSSDTQAAVELVDKQV